jgi:hypothetical protein
MGAVGGSRGDPAQELNLQAGTGHYCRRSEG